LVTLGSPGVETHRRWDAVRHRDGRAGLRLADERALRRGDVATLVPPLALHDGHVSVAQPLLATELVFMLILRRVWIHQSIRPITWGATVVTCVSLTVFILAGQPGGGQYTPVSKRRVARTKAAIEDAFVQLVLERGYDRVAVEDITDRADLARATFYAHYPNKEAVQFSVFNRLTEDLAGATASGRCSAGGTPSPATCAGNAATPSTTWRSPPTAAKPVLRLASRRRRPVKPPFR
jgi:Bacterial regulatory proteins, tetR family